MLEYVEDHREDAEGLLIDRTNACSGVSWCAIVCFGILIVLGRELGFESWDVAISELKQKNNTISDFMN